MDEVKRNLLVGTSSLKNAQMARGLLLTMIQTCKQVSALSEDGRMIVASFSIEGGRSNTGSGVEITSGSLMRNE